MKTNKYLESINAKQVEMEAQIRNMDEWKVWFEEKVADFNKNFATIERGLKNIGFKFSSNEENNISFDGYYQEKWMYENKTQKMEINVRIDMVGNMNPIGKHYFTKKESDKIRDRFIAKEKKFKEITGYQISLNRYSMEEKAQDCMATILI